MFQAVFFKLLDVWRFFKPKNWKIYSIGTYTDGMPYVEYYYNGTRYTYVGHDTFPPEYRVSKFPLVSAKTHSGKDVTRIIKSFVGPLSCDEPDIGYVLFKKSWKLECFVSLRGVKICYSQEREKDTQCEDVFIKRLFENYSVFGAK